MRHKRHQKKAFLISEKKNSRRNEEDLAKEKKKKTWYGEFGRKLFTGSCTGCKPEISMSKGGYETSGPP